MSDAQNTGNEARRYATDAAARRVAAGADRGRRSHRRRGRTARCRSGAAGDPQRGARSAVRAGAGKGRSVRPRHQPGRDAAAVDRRGRAYRDGARQAHLSLRAGHPLRPHRARRIARRARDRRCRHRLRRTPHDRARTCDGRNADARAGAGRRKTRRGGFWMFVLGFIIGALALFGLALFASLRNL